MSDTASVTLTIDDRTVTVPAGSTLLAAAAALDIDVPTICYHPHLTANGLCRACVVEVEGGRVLQAACVAHVAPNMVVHTHSERVQTARRTITEMLMASVDCTEAQDVLDCAAETGADATRFAELVEPRAPAVRDDNPMFVRDYAKCILCWRCVQACAEDAQYTFALDFSGRGYDTQIATFFDAPLSATPCVFCGQCVQACPTGALKPRRAWLLEQGMSPEQIIDLARAQKRERRMKQNAPPRENHEETHA